MLNENKGVEGVNYYELLEVAPTASEEVIKMAYKALVKKYHPDAYEGDLDYAESMIKKINMAYDTLSDKKKRADYNQEIGIKVFDTQDEFKTKTRFSNDADQMVNKPTTNKSFDNRQGGILERIHSIFNSFIGILILYIVIGLVTGNLKEWNQNIIYYSKVVVHFVNNINLPRNYEDGSPEQVIDCYIEAVLNGDEYTALQSIDIQNEDLSNMTEGISKIFKQFQQDEMFAAMFQDMKNAEFEIAKGKVNQEYIVTFTTCDYLTIMNQVDSGIYSDSYVAKQIQQRVRIAPKDLKKEVIVNLTFNEGQWYVSGIQDLKKFLEALTGNLFRPMYEEILQQMN